MAFLGSIPLDADVVTCGDAGLPIVLEKPESVAAKAYLAIATALAAQLQEGPHRLETVFLGVEWHRRRPRVGRGRDRQIWLAHDGDWPAENESENVVRVVGRRPER